MISTKSPGSLVNVSRSGRGFQIRWQVPFWLAAIGLLALAHRPSFVVPRIRNGRLLACRSQGSSQRFPRTLSLPPFPTLRPLTGRRLARMSNLDLLPSPSVISNVVLGRKRTFRSREHPTLERTTANFTSDDDPEPARTPASLPRLSLRRLIRSRTFTLYLRSSTYLISHGPRREIVARGPFAIRRPTHVVHRSTYEGPSRPCLHAGRRPGTSSAALGLAGRLRPPGSQRGLPCQCYRDDLVDRGSSADLVLHDDGLDSPDPRFSDRGSRSGLRVCSPVHVLETAEQGGDSLWSGAPGLFPGRPGLGARPGAIGGNLRDSRSSNSIGRVTGCIWGLRCSQWPVYVKHRLAGPRIRWVYARRLGAIVAVVVVALWLLPPLARAPAIRQQKGPSGGCSVLLPVRGGHRPGKVHSSQDG